MVTRGKVPACAETPLTYITRRRLETALLYLRHSGLAIQEAARQVGYQDPLYFSRVSHKHFCCAPSRIFASGSTAPLG